MKNNNEITESQLVSGKGYLNPMHITSTDVISVVLNFGGVATMIDIVWQHTVPLNF